MAGRGQAREGCGGVPRRRRRRVVRRAPEPDAAQGTGGRALQGWAARLSAELRERLPRQGHDGRRGRDAAGGARVQRVEGARQGRRGGVREGYCRAPGGFPRVPGQGGVFPRGGQARRGGQPVQAGQEPGAQGDGGRRERRRAAGEAAELSVVHIRGVTTRARRETKESSSSASTLREGRPPNFCVIWSFVRFVPSSASW